ncbi:MAG: hypothetical protein ACREU8_08990 [Gammaproteobacteria bacterium]
MRRILRRNDYDREPGGGLRPGRPAILREAVLAVRTSLRAAPLGAREPGARA